MSTTAADSISTFGGLLRQWRREKRRSQLDLATETGTTTRHLSFLETGRSNPSRTMIVRLASALEIPLRERNILFRAAGFADAYRHSELDEAQMGVVAGVLDQFLANNEPFPAFVFDRQWTLLRANQAARTFLGMLVDLPKFMDAGPPNVIDMLFHPDGLRPHIMNWEESGRHFIQRIHREALDNREAAENLKRAMAFPGIPEEWSRMDMVNPLQPVLPLVFRVGDQNVSLISMVTTFGTPQDVTVEELRIEVMFPTDEASEAVLRRVAG